MDVVRWRFDALDGSDSYVFETNPNQMTSPFAPKQVAAQTTTAVDGQVLLTQGQRKPTEWQFTGTTLSQAHYDKLLAWKNKNQRIYLTDHFARQFIVYLTSFEPTPKGSLAYPWRHEYTMKALVLTEPTS